METEEEYMSISRRRLTKAMLYAWCAGGCFGGVIGFFVGLWVG